MLNRICNIIDKPEYCRLTSRGRRNQFGLILAEIFRTNQSLFLGRLIWGRRGVGDKGEEEKKCRRHGSASLQEVSPASSRSEMRFMV